MQIDQMMTLKSLRVRIGMTQQAVANEIGVDRQTIGRWEKDSSSMPVKFMYSFSKLYKYPMDRIFLGDSIALSEKIK